MTDAVTPWSRMHQRKKELGFTVMIFRKNFLFENYPHGIQVDIPRESKIMTDEQADFIIKVLEELLVENPEAVNYMPKSKWGW